MEEREEEIHEQGGPRPWWENLQWQLHQTLRDWQIIDWEPWHLCHLHVGETRSHGPLVLGDKFVAGPIWGAPEQGSRSVYSAWAILLEPIHYVEMVCSDLLQEEGLGPVSIYGPGIVTITRDNLHCGRREWKQELLGYRTQCVSGERWAGERCLECKMKFKTTKLK